MNKYTKVSDSMVAKVGLKAAWIYAKLHYRMNLSHKHHKYHDGHGYHITYKVNDLARDCHIGRNSVINSLKKLEKAGYISKIRTMFGNKIYLPKFKSNHRHSLKIHHESLETKRPREQRNKNKDIQSKSVCSPVKAKSPEKYPKLTEIVKTYGQSLVSYAVGIYHKSDKVHRALCQHINNPYHFIVGILRRWHHKGIKTVNDAMISEHDRHAKPKHDKPDIPIFKI